MSELGYGDFGAAFVYAAVTPERVVDAVRRLAGGTVELGPLRAGPGGAASVVASGQVGEPKADEIAGGLLTYSVKLPVTVSIEVKVGTLVRYGATGEIPLVLSVRTVEPLAIVIDVRPVEPDHISFHIDAHGMQAKILQRAGDVAGELRKHTARYVNERVTRPDAARFLRVPLLPMIESAWAAL